MTKAELAAWLKERQWTFTEMTEAEKVEMRRTLDICGAATSVSKYEQPCSVKPMRNGSGRCRKHGGASPRGIAHPSYEGKGYSRYSPAKWIQSLEAAANDPQLLDLRRDIELAEAGLNEALERMDLGIGDDKQTAELVGSVRTLLGALNDGEQDVAARMLDEIPLLVERTLLDYAVKEDIQKWMEIRLDLIGEESKIRHRLRLSVPLEEVGRQFDLLGSAIKTNVRRLVDRRVISRNDADNLLDAITDDFVRVAGFTSLPGSTADPE